MGALPVLNEGIGIKNVLNMFSDVGKTPSFAMIS